jgi:DNA (cytosine-5)-methyltransferase 1
MAEQEEGRDVVGGRRSIPIIDIFAGPGGLGEGFSALLDERGGNAFRIALSIEKDEVACRTLQTRAIRRYLDSAGGLGHYDAFLRGELCRAEFEHLPIVTEASGHATSQETELKAADFMQRPPRD